MDQYDEKLDRIRAAVALEPVDQIPYIGAGTEFNAVAMDVPLGDTLSDIELQCSVNIAAAQKLGIDAVQAAIFPVRGLEITWFSPVKVPGVDLDANELWQVDEVELIHQSDYDLILEEGFAKWRKDFIERNFGTVQELLGDVPSYYPTAMKRYREAGVAIMSNGSIASPFECLCGGRTLMNFLVEDMMGIPDKLEQVFAEIHRTKMEETAALLEKEAGNRRFGMWVGGWRGTPSSLGVEQFERWSWKYMVEYTDLLLQYDVTPVFHLDSSWDLGLDHFLQLPAKKCIMGLDGQTNIFKAKEIVGDHMCIMGDVPAAKLAFAKPEDIYDYSMKLCREIGPTGFLMSSGCDVPFNAKIENVNMMRKAVDDFTAGK